MQCVTVKNWDLSKSKKLMGSLGIKAPLTEIPLVGPFFF